MQIEQHRKEPALGVLCYTPPGGTPTPEEPSGRTPRLKCDLSENPKLVEEDQVPVQVVPVVFVQLLVVHK